MAETIKANSLLDQVTALLVEEGYDTWTAMEEAKKFLLDVLQKPPGVYSFHTKQGRGITVERHAVKVSISPVV